MNYSLTKKESILKLETNLRQRRLQATAFSWICFFLVICAFAALMRTPEFMAAQEIGKLLGTLAFNIIVGLGTADNIHTHIFLSRWLRAVEQQKKGQRPHSAK